MPEADLVWANPAGVGASFSGTGTAEGMRNHRGASDARPCAYADGDSTEVFGVTGGGVPEGEDGDPHCAGVGRAMAEFCAAAVLGVWILRIDGVPGRSRGASLNPRTGERRSAAGSID